METKTFNEKDIENQMRKALYNAKKSYILISNTYDKALASLDKEDYLVQDYGSSFPLNLKRFNRDDILSTVSEIIVNPKSEMSDLSFRGLELGKLIKKTVEIMKEDGEMNNYTQQGKMASDVDNQFVINKVCDASVKAFNEWLESYKGEFALSQVPSDTSKYSEVMGEALNDLFRNISSLSNSQISGLAESLERRARDNNVEEKTVSTAVRRGYSAYDESSRIKDNCADYSREFDKMLERFNLTTEEKTAHSKNLKDKFMTFYTSQMRARYYGDEITRTERDKMIEAFAKELKIEVKQPPQFGGF